MTKIFLGALASVVGAGSLLLARPALAADDNGTDLSSVQANGTPEPIRTGFFTETAFGGFLTVGGQDSYSSTEAFLSLGVGYDILQNLSVGFQFQLAPSVSDCYAPVPAGGTKCSVVNGKPLGSETFSLAILDLKISYRIPVAERLFIPIRVFGGVTNLAPTPDAALGDPNGSVWEASFGGASGIEWATPFEHFNLGAEISGRYVLGINALAIAVYPTVKYTF